MRKHIRIKGQTYFRLHWNLWLIASILLGGSAQAQTIRYVKPGGTGSGSSWAQASADLQVIINASAAGDQVWVAAGTYKPGGDANTDRTISFSLKNSVAIYGGFVGTETALSDRPASVTLAQPSSSTLSGDIGTVGVASDNSLHVISNTGLDNTAVLDGFVITGARIVNVAGNQPGGNGGGIYNQNSSPTIRSCFFTNNVLDFGSSGGGLYNEGNSSPSLTNCTIANNRAQAGGAICNSATSSLTITNCTFSYNISEGWPSVSGGTLTVTNCSFNNNNGLGGNSGSYGGAMAIGTGSTVSNCLFVSNNGQGYGGAIAISGNPTLTNCTFRGNLASGFGGVGNPYGYGGAIYIEGGNPVIINCSFSNNYAAGRLTTLGGAIYNVNSTPTFINCSFGNNKTDGVGGAIFNQSGTVTLINSVVWGNTPNGISTVSGAATTLTYTDTQDGTAGTGNLSADPLFVDAPNDNLRLRACSPAVDRGNNSVSAGDKDVVNNPRRVRTIDMGAYEFQGTPLSLVAINQQPGTFYSIPQGGTLTATALATGSVTGYQWYKDGVALTGLASATTATLTLPNLTTADQGRYYVVVTGSCNSVTSSSFSLLVNTGMYTLKTGSWDDPSIWSLNRVPVGSDPVRLKHAVNVPASYVAHARTISYDPSQRLRLGSGSRLQLNR